MPKLPEFKHSNKKAYYRRKEIKHFISQLNKYLAEEKNQSIESINSLTMVRDLLIKLVEFRKLSDPKKFSRENYLPSLGEVNGALKKLEDQSDFINEEINKTLVAQAIVYVERSIVLRITHLEQKRLISKTDTEINSPMPFLEDWERPQTPLHAEGFETTNETELSTSMQTEGFSGPTTPTEPEPNPLLQAEVSDDATIETEPNPLLQAEVNSNTFGQDTPAWVDEYEEERESQIREEEPFTHAMPRFGATSYLQEKVTSDRKIDEEEEDEYDRPAQNKEEFTGIPEFDLDLDSPSNPEIGSGLPMDLETESESQMQFETNNNAPRQANPDCYTSPEDYRDEQAKIKLNEYAVVQILGEGNFGIVYKAKINDESVRRDLEDTRLLEKDDNTVIIKILKNQDEKQLLAFKKEGILADRIREAALRGGPGSQYISLNTLAVNSRNELLIVGKIESRGTLWHMLSAQASQNTSAATRIKYLRQIYQQQKEGLLFLHRNNFLHRDFAMRNLLVSSKGNIIITDYGLAEQITSNPNAEASYGVDTKLPRRWLDDKSLFTGRSNRDSDIFSLKVTMLEEFATILTSDPVALWLKTSVEECEKLHRQGDVAYLQFLSDNLYNFINDPKLVKDLNERAMYIEYLKEICANFQIPLPTPLKSSRIELETTKITATIENSPQSTAPTQAPPPAVDPELPDYPTSSVKGRVTTYDSSNGQQKNRGTQSQTVSKLASSENLTVRQAHSLFQTADKQTQNQTNRYIPQPKDNKR